MTNKPFSHCIGLPTLKPTDGVFQLYCPCLEALVAPVPQSLPLANAAVFPLSISSASAGLFLKSALYLPFPTSNPKQRSERVLIWGGSSSVGSRRFNWLWRRDLWS